MRDTIDMARESGIELDLINEDEGQIWYITTGTLKAFEALVRADERNRVWSQKHWTEYEQAIAQAECEACAEAAENFLTSCRSPLGRSVAAAILARGVASKRGETK